MRNYDYSWGHVKEKFDLIPFPSMEGEITNNDRSHHINGKEHHTTTYSYNENKHNFNIGGYEYEFKYIYCPECEKTIKRFGALFNDNNNKCFYKEY